MSFSRPLWFILALWLPTGGRCLIPASRAGSVDFAGPLPARFQIQALPGHPDFVFSLYGAPGELKELRELVDFLRERHLGNGFDPGPGLQPAARPLFDFLASRNWPVMIYPGCADMQIDGGRCALGPAQAGVLKPMDQAGVFIAAQLGEWGYYFHNLSARESWWRDVYGPDFEQFKQLIKPAGLAGYARRPTSRRECFEVVGAYFTNRSRALLDRVISVTGHSHYEAYAGEWGAKCIGLEVGENIAFTQSKLAFARGASRQWQRPWSTQVSPWFAGACTTSGPLRTESGGARGLEAGHSLSFYERMWLRAWFAGAAMVTPENSLAIFFEQPAAPWTLTAHGRKAAEIFQFMSAHDRGAPYTPVAVVLDHLAGYNGYMDRPWGILEPTPGDRETRDLFDAQLFPGGDHIHTKPSPENPEAGYLRPTPYGEIFDVQLSSAAAEMLASYPVLLLAGDFDFNAEFLAKLTQALDSGTKLLLSPGHRAALGDHFSSLARHPGVEVLAPWTNPATGRPAAIPAARLQQLAREVLPIQVSGDPVGFAINRTTNGWLVELSNHGGVAKRPNQPAITDAKAIARVTITPAFQPVMVRELRAERTLPATPSLRFEIGPGQTQFIELVGPRPAPPAK